MSDKVIVTGETISRVAEMIAAHNAKVAALEAELELTRKAVRIFARDTTNRPCRYCAYYKLGVGCKAKKDKDCDDGYVAWAMEKAKEEQK